MDQPVERLRDRRVVPGGRDRRRVDVLRDDRHGVVAAERRAAGDHLVEAHPEGVEVAARVGRAPHGLLRRHVGHRAHHHALLGDARAILGDGQAEVSERRAPVLTEPDVARLQVAVDDAALPWACSRPRHTSSAMRIARAGGPPRMRAGGLHVTPRHELAHDEELALLVADVEDRDHVRVVAELSMACASCRTRVAGVVEPVRLDQRQRDVAPRRSSRAR